MTNWPEGKDSGMPPEEVVSRAEEAPPYNELSDKEKQDALFTDGSCRPMAPLRDQGSLPTFPVGPL